MAAHAVTVASRGKGEGLGAAGQVDGTRHVYGGSWTEGGARDGVVDATEVGGVLGRVYGAVVEVQGAEDRGEIVRSRGH